MFLYIIVDFKAISRQNDLTISLRFALKRKTFDQRGRNIDHIKLEYFLPFWCPVGENC